MDEKVLLLLPPPWASIDHLSWLRMPIILAAIGHPSGDFILNSLSSTRLLARPTSNALQRGEDRTVAL